MTNSHFYAHSREGDPDPAHWQPLEQHLEAVAELAADFAIAFDSEAHAHLAGLWHDLGKYQPDFQRRLAGERVSVEHSGAGAAFALERERTLGMALAFAIVGHHGGMPNAVQSGPDYPTPLRERLQSNEKVLNEIRQHIAGSIRGHAIPPSPSFLKPDPPEKSSAKLRAEFWIRFLFSCLVDADWLDTERFLEPTRFGTRAGFDSIDVLRGRLDAHIDDKVAGLSAEERGSRVNMARASILDACRKASELEPGLFALTVPTGGGKTLSAMSFALRHAEHREMERVIVVIPYTSIIEQNASVYRDALGSENVVEHHSNLDPVKEFKERGEEVFNRHRLAAENWDAPIIVTTTVQFFESLFSSKPSRCRKAHSIANSVVVLDEVQTLPSGYLLTILDALNQLVVHYRCTIVLSTATPPALAEREHFTMGLRNVRPIIADPIALAADLKRVEYEWPSLEGPAVEWPDLAARVAEEPRVLAVVHRRQDARDLAELVRERRPDEPLFHLSALMCPAHRLDTLAKIRAALDEEGACRVISTQLVEAGVDLDFPVVFRALGGLDSIVQAAGRCNREGRSESGRVVVFRAPTKPPPGTPGRALETTEVMLRSNGGSLNPDEPTVFERYFRRLYAVEALDVCNIQREREQFNFATVGWDFRLIEDGFTKSVVVPYGEADKRLAKIPPTGATKDWLRSLQPFIVNIYPNAFDALMKAGAVSEVTDGVFSLTVPFKHMYDETFGLVTGDAPLAAPEALLV